MVAVATYGGHAYCRDEWIKNTLAVTKGHDVYLLWNGPGNPKKIFPKHWTIETMKDDGLTGLRILEKKHQKIRRRFLSRSYSHLFMLESDTFPPVGTIEKFIAYKRDLVSALYFIKSESKMVVDIPDTANNRAKYGAKFCGTPLYIVKQMTIPTVWGLVNNPSLSESYHIEGMELDEVATAQAKSRLWRVEDALPQRGLVRCLSAGVGSVLISREVLEQIDFRVQDGEIQQFTDFMLWWDAYRLGFKGFVDTDTWANHIHPFDDLGARDKWFDAKTGKEGFSHVESHQF